MARSPEVIEIGTEHARGYYKTSLYKGMVHDGFKSNYDDVIVLAPGWLGSGTLHFAANSLARRGHDVAVVDHSHTSLLHASRDRSQHVHFTARAAAAATGKQGVIMIGHSNGNQDVHHAAANALIHQQTHQGDKTLYRVNAIGSIAGAGLSGAQINAYHAQREVFELMSMLREHPVAEFEVVARSVSNYFRHPILSAVEGVDAALCDVRPDAWNIINKGALRAYDETYFDKDSVIPRPDRTDFENMPGSHMTPVVCGDTVPAIAERLYQGNNPHSLQIAHYAEAA